MPTRLAYAACAFSVVLGLAVLFGLGLPALDHGRTAIGSAVAVCAALVSFSSPKVGTASRHVGSGHESVGPQGHGMNSVRRQPSADDTVDVHDLLGPGRSLGRRPNGHVPLVPVSAWLPLGGRERPGELLAWAHNPNGAYRAAATAA